LLRSRSDTLPQVLQLVEGGPAQKCGRIAEGDIISEVDSVAMLGKGLPELLKALSGPPGSVANLSFMRFVGAEITPYTVSVVRESQRLESSRVGCGVAVRLAPYGFLEISSVDAHVLSSADVRCGDIVLAIDGTMTTDAQLLLGPPGTDCRLTLQRGQGAQAARCISVSYGFVEMCVNATSGLPSCSSEVEPPLWTPLAQFPWSSSLPSKAACTSCAAMQPFLV
jgi:C-terminal processing protease CtpA/Prc